MFAPQPGEDGNQDADDDEEAERNHPYPQPVPFALSPQPGLAVCPPREQGQYIMPRSSAEGKGGDGLEGLRTSV